MNTCASCGTTLAADNQHPTTENIDCFYARTSYPTEESQRMNATPALQQLLRSTRYNIAQIDADLAKPRGVSMTRDQLYHQGYQTGRKAELESLATTLEMALAAAAAVDR